MSCAAHTPRGALWPTLALSLLLLPFVLLWVAAVRSGSGGGGGKVTAAAAAALKVRLVCHLLWRSRSFRSVSRNQVVLLSQTHHTRMRVRVPEISDTGETSS